MRVVAAEECGGTIRLTSPTGSLVEADLLPVDRPDFNSDRLNSCCRQA